MNIKSQKDFFSGLMFMAVGMAFADTIIAETDAHVTIVDRQARPGG